MAITKIWCKLNAFEEYMSGMRGYIKCNIDDDEHISSKTAKSSYDNILKYANIDSFDLNQNNRDCKVRLNLTEFEIQLFYGCRDFKEFDDEEVDFFEFFKEKYANYQKGRQERFAYIKKKYYEYLDSDKVNDRGRKSKAHFCRISGYSTYELSEALK